MAYVIVSMYDDFIDMFDKNGDPRVEDYFLMRGPLPTLLICLSYVFIVKYLGPKLMENRKPFDLKYTLMVYNVFQVILSSYLFYEALAAGWWNDYSFRCQPIDYSNNPKALRMARGCYVYFLSKFSEFMDTFFMVLRKKNDHISSLHVIHHGIMPISTWWGVKFTPGGAASFFGLINTFVHIVMYFYYFLAAMGPRVQPYLWWKKYLTTLQMVQFILIVVHYSQMFFIECNFPKTFRVFIAMHAVLFFVLFKEFYSEAYTKKANQAAKSKKSQLEEKYAQNQNSGQKNDSSYPSQYKMTTGYISDNGLRNRVFIDNQSQNRT